MPGEVRVSGADLSEARVVRLIDPTVLAALAHDRYVVRVVWVKDVPVAVAAARLCGGDAELLSLACLTDARTTPALSWAITDLRRTARASVVYDPWNPPAPHIVAALTSAGMKPSGPRWKWYEFDPAVVASVLPTVRITLQAATLRDVAVSGYDPHPDDNLQRSPVLLADAPVAYAVVRHTAGIHMLAWAWVDPAHRGKGLIVQLCAEVLHGLDAPLRFRVEPSNAAVNRAVETAPEGALVPLHSIATWRG